MHRETEIHSLTDTAEMILALAKKHGVSQAETVVDSGLGLSVAVRLGNVESLSFHEGKSASVTLYLNQRTGTASTTDLSPTALATMVQAAYDIVQFTEADPCFGLADAELMAKNYPDLDRYTPWNIDSTTAIAMAIQAEQKALSWDKRIINSDGASIDTGESHYVYANTQDFCGHFSETAHSFSCSLVAQDGKDMQRGSDYTYAFSADRLQSMDDVAVNAAKKALASLNPKKLPTQKTSVIFDANISSHLLSIFISAISGGNLYRQSTFLVNHLGKPIFPKWLNIVEDPHQPNVIGSMAFDAEGVLTRKKHFIQDGILTSYILGSYSGRRLGMETTANAGGVHNVILSSNQATHIAPDQTALLKCMGTGVLVTSLMGSSVNILTGDYSRGAAGFWVENGEIQYPVQEFTIASHLQTMFMNIQAIAQDIDNRKNIKMGSILLSDMMIAGE